jgi:Ras-related C3 botulinum toxin substrate 1
MDNSIKCVAVGDGAIGKTCLLVSYATNTFPTEYIPTVFDNYNANVSYKNEIYSLGLWDTAGQEDYDKLRPLSYPDTNCFLLCYSIVNPTSFRNVKTKWMTEIKEFSVEVPIILVGLKEDCRNDEEILKKLQERDQLPITKEQGENLAKEIDAFKFIEVSAKNQKGLKETFDSCIESVFKPKKIKIEKSIKKDKCLIF